MKNNAMRYMLMIQSKKFKLLTAILMAVAISSSGIVDLSFADNTKIKVDCGDIALALITWDQLLAIAEADDVAENEHELNDKNVEPNLYANIINDHLENLLEHVRNECDNNDSNIDALLDKIGFELPF